MVRSYTLRQLKKYNATKNWKPRYKFEQIPTLEEVFTLLGNSIGINIEIKRERTSKEQFDLLNKCVSLTHEYKMNDNVMFTSFSRRVVREVGTLNPRLFRGLLYDPYLPTFRSPVTSAKSLGVKYLILNWRGLHKKISCAVHSSNLLLGAYTINTTKQIERSMKYGIEAIITNYPSEVLAFLNRK